MKEFHAHMQNQQQLLDAAAEGHQAQLQDMQQRLEQPQAGLRPVRRPGQRLQETVGQFNMDDQLKPRPDLLQEVNRHKKALFVEIQQVVAEMAKQKGLDLVIVEPEVQLPTSVQNVDPEQLNNLISQKTVLYASPRVDLTDEVATAMDAAYKAKPK